MGRHDTLGGAAAAVRVVPRNLKESFVRLCFMLVLTGSDGNTLYCRCKVRALITEGRRNHNSASECRRPGRSEKSNGMGMTDCLRGSNRQFSHFAVSNDELLDYLILRTFVDDISLLHFLSLRLSWA